MYGSWSNCINLIDYSLVTVDQSYRRVWASAWIYSFIITMIGLIICFHDIIPSLLQHIDTCIYFSAAEPELKIQTFVSMKAQISIIFIHIHEKCICYPFKTCLTKLYLHYKCNARTFGSVTEIARVMMMRMNDDELSSVELRWELLNEGGGVLFVDWNNFLRSIMNIQNHHTPIKLNRWYTLSNLAVALIWQNPCIQEVFWWLM